MRGFVFRRGWVRALTALLGLTASYALIGRLGLLLAVPPGYATAIFPSAGIAIGGMLILGRIALPATFVGAFVLYLWIGLESAHGVGWLEIATDLIIAFASTAQAALGGLMLRRTVGYPAHLDNVRDVLRFFLVCPVACMTSATLALSGIYALGAIAPTEFSSSWYVWWIGDTLGVIVVVPLMLAAIGQPRASWRRRGPYIAVPIVLLFGIFVAIFSRVSDWERGQSLLEFRVRSQQLADRAQSSLAEQSIFLEQLGSAFGSLHSAISAQDFNVLVSKLLRRFSTIQAVEWAPRIADTDRAGFVAAQRGQKPGFSITEHDAANGMRPAARRPFYYPVTYLEPLAGNTEAIGYDLASDPDRRAAIERAIASGRAASTAPVRLVQEHGQQAGILLIAPIPNGPNGPGVVLIVLRMGTFTKRLLSPLQSVMRVRFADAAAAEPLFDDLKPATRPAFAANFSFGGHQYVLQSSPKQAYWAAHQRLESNAVLLAGLFSTGLLGALLMLGSGQAQRAQLLVDERTAELRVANQRLRDEMTERERAVSALQQSRHMEAIGQLTGGVAHDFNNLLTIIIGNLELLHARVRDAADRRLIETAQTGAEQGARLVDSLLAFARRQALRPEIVDLNRLIGEFGGLMRRAAGETIELRLALHADRALCRIDPAQFQAALLNLVVNAREAMPQSGVLTIDTRNAAFAPTERESEASPSAGPYVAIIVRDTGVGMAPEILDRVFEPFYTTREVGRGSGLGLSQVYGFVKQSGGHVRISSAPGIGTAVWLYLPVAAPDSDPASAGSRASGEVAGGTETILVVEDDPALRELTAERLQAFGYRILAAADGPEALDILERGEERIDLLFSDVVMPRGISGDELARRAAALRPELKVLLASGYALARPADTGHQLRLLRKPYHGADLAEAVRAALDGE